MCLMSTYKRKAREQDKLPYGPLLTFRFHVSLQVCFKHICPVEVTVTYQSETVDVLRKIVKLSQIVIYYFWGVFFRK